MAFYDFTVDEWCRAIENSGLPNFEIFTINCFDMLVFLHVCSRNPVFIEIPKCHIRYIDSCTYLPTEIETSVPDFV